MSDLILSSLYRDRSYLFLLPTYTQATEARLAKNREHIHSLHGEDFIGIEYEIENCELTRDLPVALSRVFRNYWTSTDDGSLRNTGIEFISKPIKGIHVANALLSLKSVLLTSFENHKATSRCGIHIHINALDLTVPQLFAWISTYMVFERQLFKYSGGRDKNLFCLPTWAWAGNIKGALVYLCGSDNRAQERAVRSLQEQGLKYAGLNTIPLGEHGTLEFRQMNTSTDFNKISLWVDLLTRIKAHSRSINSVKDLEAYWKRIGSLTTSSEYGFFMEEVFGIICPELHFDGYEAMMGEGAIAVKELEILYYRNRANLIPSVVRSSALSEMLRANQNNQGNANIQEMIAQLQVRYADIQPIEAL